MARNNTRPHRFSFSLARNAAGIVLLLVLVLGALSVVYSLFTHRITLSSASWSRAYVVQGEVFRDFAAELAQTPFAKALAAAERGVSWVLVGSLGPRVQQGCDQWLFLTDELQIHAHGLANMQKRLTAVAQVRTKLAQKKIDLVLLTVPDKSRVQQAQLCRTYRSDALAPRLSVWEAGLAKNHINYVPLLTAMLSVNDAGGSQTFLRTDTHWTELGARTAAQEVAKTIDKNGYTTTPRRHYVQQAGAPRAQWGDLVRLAGIAWLPAAWLPLPDQVVDSTFSIREQDELMPHGSEENSLLPDEGLDVFGDVNLPSVALVGTSYSRTSAFIGFLQQALATPVPSFAQDGGDFWLSMRNFLAGRELQETPPRLLLWEIPERVLQMPVGEAEDAWLRGLAQP